MPVNCLSNQIRTAFKLSALFLFLIIINWGCKMGGGSDSRLASDYQREKELNEKELRLKDAELRYKQREDSLRNQSATPTLSQYYEKEKDAVWMIYTKSDDQIAQGSGFVINE